MLRRGLEVEELWDQMFHARRREGRPVRLLYIGGKGFDLRSGAVLSAYIERLRESGLEIADAVFALVSFTSYQLDRDLVELTQANASTMLDTFSSIGRAIDVEIGSSAGGEDDLTTTASLREAAGKIAALTDDRTEVVLDVSSLSRNAYLTILLRILGKLIPNPDAGKNALAIPVNFQVIAGEDANLDSLIRAEDLGNELVLIPGYSEGLHSEAMQHLPLVWFPILGENRVAQMAKVEMDIPSWAEICPVLPHPSLDARRGDKLLLEYENALFARRNVSLNSIMHAHETNPFEAYRQMLNAMRRYYRALSILGGCRITVTPLASKLITVGSALACFEMKSTRAPAQPLSVAIANAEPRRYAVERQSIESSKPTLSAIVLAGQPYQQ